MISLMDAIKSINPNAECTVPENVDNIIWLNNTTPIAKADILAKQKELQTEYDNNKYQETEQWLTQVFKTNLICSIGIM